MSKAQELLANPEFNSLPIDVQNRLLIEALSTPMAALEPEILPTEPVQEQGVITYIQGQPFLLTPLNDDPNAGIEGPAPVQRTAPSGVEIAKTTIGSVGDALKTGIGLTLGAVGILGSLAVDIVTFGQSKGSVTPGAPK